MSPRPTECAGGPPFSPGRSRTTPTFPSATAFSSDSVLLPAAPAMAAGVASALGLAAAFRQINGELIRLHIEARILHDHMPGENPDRFRGIEEGLLRINFRGDRLSFGSSAHHRFFCRSSFSFFGLRRRAQSNVARALNFAPANASAPRKFAQQSGARRRMRKLLHCAGFFAASLEFGDDHFHIANECAFVRERVEFRFDRPRCENRSGSPSFAHARRRRACSESSIETGISIIKSAAFSGVKVVIFMSVKLQ